jgi:predicted Zn-dependent protease
MPDHDPFAPRPRPHPGSRFATPGYSRGPVVPQSFRVSAPRRTPAAHLRGPRVGGAGKARLLIAGVVALFAIISYFSASSVNPVTGQSQRVALSVPQEIQLGLQAAPEMAAQHGGLHPDRDAQALVDSVGARLVQAAERLTKVQIPYPFEFHLLADPKTVNAFALPGGQIFITAALYERLETEGQLAGVLGHEVGHVIERHGGERLANQQLTQGLIQAVAMGSESMSAAQVAQMVGGVITMKYGREDELESDKWGVLLSTEAGYDPNAMRRVMEILREASGGGSGQPEFMSTHPDPGNRIERIEQHIRELYPQGLPEGLTP